MTNKLAEINAKVLPTTKEALEGIADAGGLSIGEVIDRMMVKLSPEDAHDAALLILDNLLIATKRLNPEQLKEAILKFLKVLEGSFEDEEIISTTKGIVEKINE